MRMLLLITFSIMILLTVDGGYVYGMDPCGDSCSAAGQSRECMCRTYTFGMTLISPWSFLNSTTGEVYGLAVDLIKLICEKAGKLCKFAGTGMPSCWDGTVSEVLNERRYDACGILAKTPRRLAKYAYTEISISSGGHPTIWSRPSANITMDKLRSSHDFRLGYFAIDVPIFIEVFESYLEEGYFIKNKNIVYMEGDTDAAIAQLSSQLSCGSGNSIDFVLVPPVVFPPRNFTFIAELEYDVGNAHMMTRKDNQCLLKWYDEAYRNVICSDEYPALCQEWTESSGEKATDFCQDRNSICN